MFATKGVIYARQGEIKRLLEQDLAEGPIETKSFRKRSLPWRSGQVRAVRAAEKFAMENAYDIMVSKRTTPTIEGEWELEYDFYISPDRY